jgi:hypothetical protein
MSLGSASQGTRRGGRSVGNRLSTAPRKALMFCACACDRIARHRAPVRVRVEGCVTLMSQALILRNYEGETFIHGVCKEIVRQSGDDTAIQNEVAIALETTGVVSGEYGMAEAYERKKLEITPWLSDPDERIRGFAEKYVASLDKMIAAEQARAREGIALRKHRFGEE